MKDDKTLKSEKELLDEEMKKWPEELEKEAAKINKESNLLQETASCDFKSIEDIRKHYNSMPWNEYVKKWMK